MTEVRFMPPAAKYLKKIKDKKLSRQGDGDVVWLDRTDRTREQPCRPGTQNT